MPYSSKPVPQPPRRSNTMPRPSRPAPTSREVPDEAFIDPAGRHVAPPTHCQLQFTGVEGGQERDLRPLATETEGSASRRSGARPHRPTRRRQPGRRQTRRRGHLRTADQLWPRLPDLLPAGRRQADRAAVRWRQVNPGRRHQGRERIAKEWKETRNDDKDR